MKKRLLTIGAILVAGLIVVWAISVSNRVAEERRIEREQVAEFNRQVKFDNCTDFAFEAYTNDWNEGCRLENDKDGCDLPTWRANASDETYKESLDRCVKLYGN